MTAILRVVRSEWLKLLRPGMLFGGLGTMAGIATLFAAILTSVGAGGPSGEQGGPPQAELSFDAPDGSVFALSLLANLLGTVSLVLFAQGMGAEFGQGTLKVLLSREPRRILVLAGKFLAMAAFVLVGVLLATVGQGIAAAAILLGKGISIAAWWTAAGLGDAALTVVRVWVACVAWGAMGMTLAVVLRSAPAAIGIGLGYALVVESLLQLVASLNGQDWAKWLPGNVIANFAVGSAAEMTRGPFAVDAWPAALAMAAYALGFLALAASLLHRRDVAG